MSRDSDIEIRVLAELEVTMERVPDALVDSTDELVAAYRAGGKLALRAALEKRVREIQQTISNALRTLRTEESARRPRRFSKPRLI